MANLHVNGGELVVLPEVCRPFAAHARFLQPLAHPMTSRCMQNIPRLHPAPNCQIPAQELTLIPYMGCIYREEISHRGNSLINYQRHRTTMLVDIIGKCAKLATQDYQMLAMP